MTRVLGLVLLVVVGLLLPSPVAADDVAPACVQPPPRDEAATITVLHSVSPGVVETRIHWTRWSTRLVYGRDALLEGQVATDDGALADVTVDLYARPSGAADWTRVSTQSSDPETGVFTFPCLDTPRTTDYRVTFDGTLLYASSEADKHVAVARRVESTMRLRPDGRFRFAGSVAPSYTGRRVVLQRKGCAGCAWQRVTAHSTDQDSRWRFVVSAPDRGARYFRALVPGDASFTVGRSQVWRVRR